MTNLRVKNDEYVGNQQYRSSAGPHLKYCFGCKTHRFAAGGKVLTKLKLYYCKTCATLKEQPK